MLVHLPNCGDHEAHQTLLGNGGMKRLVPRVTVKLSLNVRFGEL